MEAPLISILIPVLARPRNAQPVVDSIKDSTSIAYEVLFLCSPGDDAEIEACRETGERVWVTTFPAGQGNYARKINLGYTLASAPYLFLGADDLRFEPDWDVEALKVAQETGAGVVGTNDLANPEVMKGRHATHFLVRREYAKRGATVDGSGQILHEGYDHQCNPPESPIWMADLSLRPLGEIQEGDEVIGWHRPATDLTFDLRRLIKATVLSVMERQAPLVRVVMASGREFRCTPDHLWLNALWSPSTQHPREWVTPKVGRTLSHLVDPTEAIALEDRHLAGWLGGIFDGEGSAAPNPQLAQDEVYNPEVYEAICEALDHFGLEYARRKDRVSITGGRRNLLRFLHIAQPVKRASIVDYIISAARFGIRDKIVAVEPAGEGWVMSMMTTTGNYVCNGYASKNCIDLELLETARARGEWAMALNSHVRHLHPIFNRQVAMDDTYEKALAHGQEDRRLFFRRRRLWVAI